MSSSSEFLSKRVKKISATGLSTTRYKYLSLDQAEPDLGDPLVGPSSVGSKVFPPRDAYLLVSFGQQNEENPSRFWIPPSSLTGLGLGLVPGAITVKDEGVVVGAASSTTTFDFIGVGVTVDRVSIAATQQTGIATVRITSPGFGSIGEFQYHGANGLLAGSTGIKFDPATTFVGIGSTSPTVKLDVTGNLKVSSQTTSSLLSVIGVGTITQLNSSNASFTGITTIANGNISNEVVGIQTVTTSNVTNQTISGVSTIATLNATRATITNLTSTASTTGILSATTANIISIGASFANIGISTVGFQTVTNFYAGLATITTGIITTANINTANINIAEISRANIGVASATGSQIGVATITTLIATNSNVSGISTINNANVTGIITTNNLSVTNKAKITNDLEVDTNSLYVNSSLNRVGIGSTVPEYRLDVLGDVRFNEVIYASNGRGNTGEVLTSQGPNPAVWAPAVNVTVGAANSTLITDSPTSSDIHYITFSSNTSDIGYSYVDSNGLVYLPSSNRLGIGSTQPGFSVDVDGNINFTGTLYKNGDLYVASRWGIDPSDNIFRLNGNIGIGTSILSSKFEVSGASRFNGNIILTPSSSLGIGTTQPRSKLDVAGDSRLNGLANFEAAVTEKVASNFGTNFSSTAGTISINCSASSIIVGTLTESVSTWAFTGLSTEAGKSTTVTLIIDSSSLFTYGENCTVNGVSVSGGVRWNGGIAPITTDNEDILSFAIIRDNAGTIRVYGSSSLNFS
jgi:hypothetical protein